MSLNKLRISLQRKPRMGDIVEFVDKKFYKLLGSKGLIIEIKGDVVSIIDDSGKYNHFIWKSSEGITKKWIILNPKNREVQEFKDRCMSQLGLDIIE